jgi:hypothetical protein
MSPCLESLITVVLTAFITRSAVAVPLTILSFIRNLVLATESLRTRERREVRIVRIRVSVQIRFGVQVAEAWCLALNLRSFGLV